MTSPAALHSSETTDHRTPADIVEAGRFTLDCIDVDPFSSAGANLVVRAARYADGVIANGFVESWGDEGEGACAFVNPPGGKYVQTAAGPERIEDGPGWSGAALAWFKLLDEYRAGRVGAAIFVCFSLNVLQAAQQRGETARPSKRSRLEIPPCAFPFCMPAKRLRYTRPDGTPGKSPPHPSAIVFVPPQEKHAARDSIKRFETAFSPFGHVRL